MAQRASRTTPSDNLTSHCDHPFRVHLRRGFTIVELLIVIVVIGILAAITIVAYNGVMGRAKASAAQSAASQANKKVLVYATTNSDTYPAALTDAGVTNGSGATYQYSVDNSANPKTYCITATNQDVSYWVSNASTTPKAGACNGHGSNGVSPITNLIPNPSLTYDGTGWSTSGDIGAIRTQISGDWGWQGVRTSNGPAVMQCTSTCAVPLTVGTKYTASATVTASADQIVTLRLRRPGGTITLSQSADINLVAGVPKRISFSVTAIEASEYLAVYSNTAAASTTLRVDNFMLTEGDTLYSFADGDSTGWVWTGTPGNSSSTGTPL